MLEEEKEEEDGDVQIANWRKAIEVGYEACVCEEHVDAAVTYYLGGVVGGLF